MCTWPSASSSVEWPTSSWRGEHGAPDSSSPAGHPLQAGSGTRAEPRGLWPLRVHTPQASPPLPLATSSAVAGPLWRPSAEGPGVRPAHPVSALLLPRHKPGPQDEPHRGPHAGHVAQPGASRGGGVNGGQGTLQQGVGGLRSRRELARAQLGHQRGSGCRQGRGGRRPECRAGPEPDTTPHSRRGHTDPLRASWGGGGSRNRHSPSRCLWGSGLGDVGM